MSEQTVLEHDGDTAEPVISVTDAALAKVLEVRDGEDDPAGLALQIDVTGVSGVDYVYDLAFTPVDELPSDSHRWEVGDLQMAVGEESRSKLAGATLDLPSNPAQGGLIIRNPNRPNPLGDVGELLLEGEVPERIAQLLEQNVNPMLASHGGFATLVGVDGHTAYVTMGGGCQGCSMSQATLTEGIQRAIVEAIPEITEVIDSTDHSAGDNPFFT
jgi:Fe/S biogenesis protein NfuA